jgi:hypothetical protein
MTTISRRLPFCIRECYLIRHLGGNLNNRTPSFKRCLLRDFEISLRTVIGFQPPRHTPGHTSPPLCRATGGRAKSATPNFHIFVVHGPPERELVLKASTFSRIKPILQIFRKKLIQSEPGCNLLVGLDDLAPHPKHQTGSLVWLRNIQPQRVYTLMIS